MSNVGGYFIAFDEGQRNSFLSEIRGLDEGFTDALSRSDWPIRRWEVCGLMFEPGKITHWALARRGDKVVTGKVRVQFVEVSQTSISLEDLKNRLPHPNQVKVISSRTGTGGSISTATWDAIKVAVGEIDSSSLQDLERLERLKRQSADKISRAGAEIVTLERDAIGIALDAFDSSGKLRTRTLKGWTAPDRIGLSSFLDGLQGVRTIEDQIIAHDAASFPGVDETRFTVLGAVFRVGDRALEVFNMNRTRVEHSTGADLLYFNEKFDAWTLVQYKSMEKDEDAPEKSAVYRPDSTFDREIGQMHAFRADTPDD